MSHLIIDVSDIIEHRGAEKEFAGSISFEAAKMGERQVEFAEPAAVSGVLRNVSHGILAEGRVTAVVELECSRCLDKFVQPIAIDLEELFVSHPERQGGEEEKEVFPIIGNKIDLGPAVYQLILTEIPFKPLCRPDCAGICPVCGRNKNKYPHICQEEAVDIRMAKLKNLFKKERKQ